MNPRFYIILIASLLAIVNGVHAYDVNKSYMFSDWQKFLIRLFSSHGETSTARWSFKKYF